MNQPTSAILVALGLLAGGLHADEVANAFRNPPDAARPGVYWYFMDGNQNRDEMVADLCAMKDVGIGSVLFLEVDLGMPRGPVPFMSEPGPQFRPLSQLPRHRLTLIRAGTSRGFLVALGQTALHPPPNRGLRLLLRFQPH